MASEQFHFLWPVIVQTTWLVAYISSPTVGTQFGIRVTQLVSFPVLVQSTTSPWLWLYPKSAPLIVRLLTHNNVPKTYGDDIYGLIINCSFVHQVSRYAQHMNCHWRPLTMNRSPIILNFAVLRMSYFSHPFLSISSWAMTSPMPQITPVLIAWVTSGLVSSTPSYQTHRRRRGTRIRCADMEERGCIRWLYLRIPPKCTVAQCMARPSMAQHSI